MNMQSGKVAIVGVGETPFMRASPKSPLEMVVEAAHNALADAGLTPRDIDGLVGVYNLTIDEVAEALGIENVGFMSRNEAAAGASAVGGLLLAQLAIEAGLATTVLVPSSMKSSRPGGPYEFHKHDSDKADYEMPVGYYGQAVYFAAMAQRYAHEHGMTERELSAVARSSRQWALRNEKAQKKKPLDFEGYLESQMIATPLRAADCCLITDGACAYIVTSVERARDLPQPPAVAAGIGMGFHKKPMSAVLSQSEDLLGFPTQQAIERAYGMADAAPKDMKFAQIYDCFSIACINQAERIGLAERGEGARLFDSGATAPGGRIPVNTSGGHMAHAYVPGGVLMVEAVRQLRGVRGEGQVPDADIGIVSGYGAGAHAVAILRKDH